MLRCHITTQYRFAITSEQKGSQNRNSRNSPVFKPLLEGRRDGEKAIAKM